jgi:hypothetical protein
LGIVPSFGLATKEEVPPNGVREKPPPLLSDVLLLLVGLRRSFVRSLSGRTG